MSKHSATGSDWQKTRERILIRDGWQCSACGKYLKDADATVDHITPRSKGGSDEDWNLISLCRRDNAIKGDRALVRMNYVNREWLPEGL